MNRPDRELKNGQQKNGRRSRLKHKPQLHVQRGIFSGKAQGAGEEEAVKKPEPNAAAVALVLDGRRGVVGPYAAVIEKSNDAQ